MAREDLTLLHMDSVLRAYLDPLPIRSRGAFQLVSARRAEDGRPCVLVLPGANTNPIMIRMALEEVQRVHALIDHPMIPKVTRLTEFGGSPCMEFDCDATT